MAGFWAAHGIWGVSEGEVLVPVLAYEQPDGERGVDRFLLDDVGDSARAAQEALRANERGWIRAVFVADAYLDLESGRTDALIVEAVRYGLTPGSMTVGVPYRPLTDSSAFAVHRPKFIDVTGFDDDGYVTLAEAFFAGVESHERAAAVWHAHLDESL